MCSRPRAGSSHRLHMAPPHLHQLPPVQTKRVRHHSSRPRLLEAPVNMCCADHVLLGTHQPIKDSVVTPGRSCPCVGCMPSLMRTVSSSTCTQHCHRPPMLFECVTSVAYWTEMALLPQEVRLLALPHLPPPPGSPASGGWSPPPARPCGRACLQQPPGCTTRRAMPAPAAWPAVLPAWAQPASAP